MKIGQAEKSARAPHGGKVGRVQAEEIDTGFAAVSNVGPHVQFRKMREARQRRKAASANSAHAKRNDSDPA